MYQKFAFCFWVPLICCSYADPSIYAFESVITIPSASRPLQNSIVLNCGIEPPTYVPSIFWVTPQGVVVDGTTNDSHYSYIEGQVFHNNRFVYSTVLQINGLSYADAGSYKCIVDTSTNTQPRQPAVATVELVLLNNLTTSHEVLTFDGSTDHINLTCEMSFYIWPDQNLIWIRDDDNVTIQESEKYYISFGNGSELVAQNGGNQHSPSRISTLTIHDPTHCDSSTYSCVLVGTPDSKSLSITLEVPQTDDDLMCLMEVVTVNGSNKLCNPSIYLVLSLLHLSMLTIVITMT